MKESTSKTSDWLGSGVFWIICLTNFYLVLYLNPIWHVCASVECFSKALDSRTWRSALVLWNTDTIFLLQQNEESSSPNSFPKNIRNLLFVELTVWSIATTRQKLKKTLYTSGKRKAWSNLMMLHTCNAVLRRVNCTCNSPSEGLNSLIASFL